MCVWRWKGVVGGVQTGFVKGGVRGTQGGEVKGDELGVFLGCLQLAVKAETSR